MLKLKKYGVSLFIVRSDGGWVGIPKYSSGSILVSPDGKRHWYWLSLRSQSLETSDLIYNDSSLWEHFETDKHQVQHTSIADLQSNLKKFEFVHYREIVNLTDEQNTHQILNIKFNVECGDIYYCDQKIAFWFEG
jgi:hypothetical protein